MHNLPSNGNVAGVDLGVVLAFPCPGCHRWARPGTGGCGCMVCQLCGTHVPPAALNLLYRRTRSFMPERLTYN